MPVGPRLRAVPLPGVPGAQGRDAVQPPVRAVLGGGASSLPPADAVGGEAARPRARRHREDGPRRVLPHLLGPDAVREVEGDPGAGPGKRRGFDRRVRPGHHPGRSHPPRAAVRAVHQRGADGLPGRRHRLQLGAAGGGHPVRLRALWRGAHGDGLQPRDVPGPLRGAGGGLRAGLPAPARRPGGQGARDVRLGDGPARPRGGGWLRAVLRAAGGAPDGGHPRPVTGAWPDRCDGPAGSRAGRADLDGRGGGAGRRPAGATRGRAAAGGRACLRTRRTRTGASDRGRRRRH